MKITVSKTKSDKSLKKQENNPDGGYLLKSLDLSTFLKAIQEREKQELSSDIQYSDELPADSVDKVSEVFISTPKAVRLFIAQLAGTPASGDGILEKKLDYAKNLILPHTGWEAESFMERLAKDLSMPHNLKVIEREANLQAKGIFSPYEIKLAGEDNNVAHFKIFPRPCETYSIASISFLPDGDSSDLGMHYYLDIPENSDNSNFMRILDYFPGYVILIDQNHKIHFENKVFKQMFGSGKGRNCHEILKDQSTPCALCPPFNVFKSNALCINEWASAKLGKAFKLYSYPFENSDGNKLVLKVGIDITAGIKAKQALDFSEQRYHSITDNLSLGIAVLDKDLRISMANRQLKKWFPDSSKPGKSICDAFGMTCSRNGDCSHCPFKLTFADGGNHEYEFVAKGRHMEVLDANATGNNNGNSERAPRIFIEDRCYRVLSCPIKGAGGNNDATIMLLEDITKRLRVMHRLQRAQQVESMATLAGGIAHEINQPLSALHLYASGLQLLLEKQENLPVSTTRDRLSLIMNQAEKIREIIAHMRSLVMQEDAPKAHAIDFKDALSGAMDILGAQLQSHRVALEINIQPDLWDIKAVKVQLEQVLINLIGNAIHALDRLDSSENFEAQRTGTEERYQKTKFRKLIVINAINQPEQDRVRIEIADNGPGLSKGLEHSIFTPFFTTEKERQGMGLGLSIVHTFVKAWGGEVGVRNNHSELGGAAFYLMLPRVTKSSEFVE